jgi:DNA-binding MarR family transcriptional regulator
VEPASNASSPIVKPLYPEQTRRADLLSTLKGLASFLRVEGYWPNRRELAERMNCHHGALVDCIAALVAAGHAEKLHHKAGMARFRLTTEGWRFLGLAPLEPWRRKPTRNIRQRIINEAARRVLREEARAAAEVQENA